MTEATAAQNTWDGILLPGEELLWQGQPVSRLFAEDIDWAKFAMGVIFVAFSIFWMNLASELAGPFWMFGLIFFFIGLQNSLGQLLIDPWVRRHTYYSLTNKRAFVASDRPIRGRVLKSYDIRPSDILELEQGQTETIYFTTETRRRSKGGRYTVKIGFEHLADSREPFTILQRIKRGET